MSCRTVDDLKEACGGSNVHQWGNHDKSDFRDSFAIRSHCYRRSSPCFFPLLLQYCYKDISINADYWFLFWPQMIRGIGIGLINAPLVSTCFNSIRQDQTSMASGLYNVIHQLGGAVGIAMLGMILQRREFFHYAHYGQQIREVVSPSTSRALLAMQELLLQCGLEPTEVVAKGKSLLAQWVHGLAKVAAFQDPFMTAGLFVAVGVVPSLLIRTAQLSSRSRVDRYH